MAALLACLLSGCGSQISSSNPLLSPPTPTPCAASAAQFRVNCGDPASYTDKCGNVWVPDQLYSLGGWGYVAAGSSGGPGTTAISGTLDDPLFYKERYATNLEYRFTLPNGSYQVTLWFSEGYWTAPAKRVFSVVVEGVTLAPALDCYAVAGAKTATSLSATVPLSDGVLNVILAASADNAQINAIEVK
jgi:hypothetical protein